MRAARPRGVAAVRPVPALIGAVVLLQVAYPLVHGGVRDVLTVAVVVLAAAASLTHAALRHGPRTAAALALVTTLGGFAVEVLGVHTGFPFGGYHYAATLGPRLAGVPVTVALAWTMMAWPAALAARTIARSRVARVLLGGWALATWDLYLDPQMVGAGHWSWDSIGAHLPGVAQIPLSNDLGWLAVALALSAALQQWVLRPPRDARPTRGSTSGSTSARDIGDPDEVWLLGFYVWTWASSALALAAFLGLPAAALWGGLGMGTVAVPLAVALAGRRRTVA